MKLHVNVYFVTESEGGGSGKRHPIKKAMAHSHQKQKKNEIKNVILTTACKLITFMMDGCTKGVTFQKMAI